MAVSTHAPWQAVRPAGQGRHAPPTQTSRQGRSQPPQWRGSVAGSVHSPAQETWPAGQPGGGAVPSVLSDTETSGPMVTTVSAASMPPASHRLGVGVPEQPRARSDRKARKVDVARRPGGQGPPAEGGSGGTVGGRVELGTWFLRLSQRRGGCKPGVSGGEREGLPAVGRVGAAGRRAFKGLHTGKASKPTIVNPPSVDLGRFSKTAGFLLGTRLALRSVFSFKKQRDVQTDIRRTGRTTRCPGSPRGVRGNNTSPGRSTRGPWERHVIRTVDAGSVGTTRHLDGPREIHGNHARSVRSMG